MVILEQFLTEGMTAPCWYQHLSSIIPDPRTVNFSVIITLNISPCCDLHVSLETLVDLHVKL